MVVAVVGRAGGPAGEVGALLEGAVAFAEEVGLGHAHLGERRAQRRPGALADPDDRGVGGFDQGDGESPAAIAGARCLAAMTPAVSQPAVPPPTIDDVLDRLSSMASQQKTGVAREGNPGQGEDSLEAVAHAAGEAAPIGKDVEQHVVVATVRALDVSLVRLSASAKMLTALGHVVARAEVDLRALVHEGRLGPERTGVLHLAEPEQVLVAPVDRGAELEAVLVVEADEVGRVGKPGDREAALP